MYTIGFLSKTSVKENIHMDCLKEKGWEILSVDIDELIVHQKLEAVVMEEDTMAVTCHWLMEITRKFNGPIYILSTGNNYSNIVYLRLGANICLSNKIDCEEFQLTLTNLVSNSSALGKKKKKEKALDKSITMELIPSNSSILIDGEREVILTQKEFQALTILYNNPSVAISYDCFKEKLWGNEVSQTNNYRIANLIFSLRNKIEENVTRPQLIKTIRSKGYMLDLK